MSINLNFQYLIPVYCGILRVNKRVYKLDKVYRKEMCNIKIVITNINLNKNIRKML